LTIYGSDPNIHNYTRITPSNPTIAQIVYAVLNTDPILHTYRESVLLTFHQSSIHYIFEKNGFGPSFHRIASKHKLRLAINDPLG
jgi:hypothetical protein